MTSKVNFALLTVFDLANEISRNDFYQNTQHVRGTFRTWSKCFAKIVNDFLSLTTFVKSSILDIRLGSETPLYLLVLD